MNILEMNEISKSYDFGKTYSLKNINLSIPVGEICAIVGNSGSGKTTLLRLIAGLERPEKGSIKIKGKIVSSLTSITAPQHRNVGMVFQSFALFPHLTVEQNIAYGLAADERGKVEHLLELVKLSGYNDRYPDELSGGEQQRVALARTLARRPELLLLDEPFSSLDAQLKAELRQEIHNIVRALNLSMIFITHDIRDAITIADRIIFLEDGAIIEEGKPKDLFQNAKTNYVKSLFQNLKNTSEHILKIMSR